MSWVDETVSVPSCDVSVALRRTGTAGPAVVVLHAQLGVGTVFRPFGDALTSGTVAVPDLRGRGRSVCADEACYTWPRLVDDVVAVLDHLGVSEVVLAGGSFGAGIAVATALAHPELVMALALWAPPYGGTRTGWLDRQRPVQQANLDVAHAVREGGGLRVADASRRARWERHDLPSIAAAILGLGWAQPFDDLDDLARIAVPTGVFPGDDDLHPRELGDGYLATIPNAERIGQSPADFAGFVTRASAVAPLEP